MAEEKKRISIFVKLQKIATYLIHSNTIVLTKLITETWEHHNKGFKPLYMEEST